MIAIPKGIVDEAKGFARDTVDRVLTGMFGLVEAQVLRRQSYAFAHEKALFHRRMSQLIGTVPGLVGAGWRTRRHAKLALRWEAKALARAPSLAKACGLTYAA
jgi:hypothetical protein